LLTLVLVGFFAAVGATARVSTNSKEGRIHCV